MTTHPFNSSHLNSVFDNYELFDDPSTNFNNLSVDSKQCSYSHSSSGSEVNSEPRTAETKSSDESEKQPRNGKSMLYCLFLTRCLIVLS